MKHTSSHPGKKEKGCSHSQLQLPAAPTSARPLGGRVRLRPLELVLQARSGMFWLRPSSLSALALPQGCGHALGRRLFRFPSSASSRHCRSLPALPSRRPLARPSGSGGCAAARLVFPSRSPFRPHPTPPRALARAAPQLAGNSDEGTSLGGDLSSPGVSVHTGRDARPSLSFLLPSPRPGRRRRPGAADLLLGPGPPPPECLKPRVLGRWLIVCSVGLFFTPLLPEVGSLLGR